jgi:hypothetical protein
MAKKARRGKLVRWTKAHDKELRGHSRGKTPVVKVARAMKRSAGALRQRAASVLGQKFAALLIAVVRVQKRSMDARISSALLVHEKGLGEVL